MVLNILTQYPLRPFQASKRLKVTMGATPASKPKPERDPHRHLQALGPDRLLPEFKLKEAKEASGHSVHSC